MQLDYIAYNSALGWRPVIQAVCKAFPKARVKVIEFVTLTAEPILQLSEVTGWQNLSHLEQKIPNNQPVQANQPFERGFGGEG